MPFLFTFLWLKWAWILLDQFLKARFYCQMTDNTEVTVMIIFSKIRKRIRFYCIFRKNGGSDRERLHGLTIAIFLNTAHFTPVRMLMISWLTFLWHRRTPSASLLHGLTSQSFQPFYPILTSIAINCHQLLSSLHGKCNTSIISSSSDLDVRALALVLIPVSVMAVACIILFFFT